LTTTARIVLLNGVGSAGKGSLARALQSITAEPYLHVEMDRFMAMLPDAYDDHADGFTYETVLENGVPSVVITAGPVGERALCGMRCSIAAMAPQGNDLIVDNVILDGVSADYTHVLSGFQVHWVGVFAPLDVLEARERQRGDSLNGLARWQFDRAHRDMRYDLEIDTSIATPLECAEVIRNKFDL